ncbi:MAG TPA: 3-hydroxyacyl-CoA dehydrogenase NAD-binding domain-containing protein [Chitinophagaceae bacterium]|nr:3-hydroxyacyl-CoA dehydrogenase NAD-binding domain-containing protein [Chitinophagaceae bacterium]
MISTICVCGAGTMGSGIAQVAAQSGFHTILYDVNGEMLIKAGQRMQQDLETLASKQKITAAQKDETLSRLQYTSAAGDCVADIVIEAIVEQPELKVKLFNQLAAINSGITIFATNTSSLSVSAIAERVIHSERVVGMHFFNPAPIMKLVEVVRAAQTAPEVVTAVYKLAKQMGKTPVICKDAPGFIVNHVARPYYLEALKLVQLGMSDYESIDRLMEASGFKMGPFKLMDLIGNDVNYAVSCSVYEAMNKPERLKPSPLQKERVDKGELGKKTGRGYYDYSK